MIEFKLGEVMKEKNLTIQDVYEKTGVSRNTISQMINKEPKGIQFDTLDKLISNLKIPVDQIIKFIPNEKAPFYIEDVSTNHRKNTNQQYIEGKEYADEIEAYFNLRLVLDSSGSESNMNFPIKAIAKIDVSKEGKEYINEVTIYRSTSNMFYEFLEKFHSNLLEDIEVEMINIVKKALDDFEESDDLKIYFAESDEV